MKIFTARTVDLGAVMTRLGFRNPFMAIVNGNWCLSLQSLFDEWHASLRWPYNPDKNWDAFNDSLGGTSDALPTTEVIIVVASADKLLADMPVEERIRNVKILLEILSEMTGEYDLNPDLARAGVLFVADTGCEDRLNRLFESSGFTIAQFQ